MFLTSDGIRPLQTGGLIVGLFDDAVFEEDTIQLAPGDLLTVFSDGTSEATNDRDEEFGDDRIIKSVKASREPHGRDPETVLTRVFEHVHAFTVDDLQGDDMAALVLCFAAKVSTTPTSLPTVSSVRVDRRSGRGA